MKLFPTLPIAILVLAAVVGSLSFFHARFVLATDTPKPAEMTTGVAPAEKIRTSGTAPDLYSVCWKGLVFMTLGRHDGLVQVHTADNKPMTCAK